jgi:hypothetical protein
MIATLLRASCLLALFACALPARGQGVIRNDETLEAERPEAWAMRYFTATTLMTSFGPVPALGPGDWQVAAELGEVPHLDASQREVGFNGIKHEDLNKSPVFGRLRGWVGLPGGFVVELGYTPPLTLNGARPRDLWSAAIGRRLVDAQLDAANRFVLSARVLGQHGAVTGDITCPGELAGVQDYARNPYGCQAPSSDTLAMNYYGLEATAAWDAGPWTWHATGGLVRMENEVQVDAITYGFRDYSRLVARHDQGYIAAGIGRSLWRGWHVGAEVLYVPLTVLRNPNGSPDNDPLVSVRLQLRYAFERP